MAQVMKLKNVRNGTVCKHTGTKRLDRTGKYPRIYTTFPADKGVVFCKLSNGRQQVVSGSGMGNLVIFGLNDLVEVLS